ncbi:PAS-domain containing protein [Pseudosulfitobacter pseudonitzschiae]|uniref:hybrid sensor histidine kinase/response regulator n=1 Tax=Pseudosulfitobacter pseudonitzschiae TaxID=1402135 RepID=UPI001E4A6AB3|nr:PAS-domain containing protein [Pseudosulfitobacter pseudonitzschiae]
MTSLINPRDSLERQNEKLLKISQALMRKVEQNTEQSGFAYHQFERAALLETEVQQRTLELERTLDLLHESNAQLEDAKVEAETAWSNLTEAIETINEGFALFDENDRLVLFNRRFCRDLKDVEDKLRSGLFFEDYVRAVSQSRYLALPPDQSRADWAKLRQSKHRDEHVIFNASLVGDVWLQVSEHRTSRNGTVILQTDVTDIIRMERLERDKMRHREAVKLQATLDHLKQGICIFDHKLNLVGSNKRMDRLLNLMPMRGNKNITFRSLFEQLQSDLIIDSGISTEQLNAWADSVGFRDPIAFEATTRGDRIYSFFAQEMPDKGFVISVTDVTSERTASRALAEMNEKLEYLVEERTSELEDALSEAERANASKSRFVAAASHDLLQPLSAAKLFVSSISDRTENEDIRQIVSKTESALQGVEQIIEALLAISKLDAGKAVFDIQTITLAEIINPLRDEVTQIARDKGLDFAFVESSLSVISDPSYLRRIVRNLLSNAVRYTARGRILAGVRRVGNHARIEVWDTGCGIAQKDQEAIFREFNQINPNPSNSGLGLGLAIVERACKSLDHPLFLWSEPDVGSCFSVLVPLARSADLSDRAQSEANTHRRGRLDGTLALLVDNNQNVCQAVTQLIKDQGGEVISAASADEALKIIDEIDVIPDALLLDYQLGTGLNGVELYQELNSRYGRIKTAIISADRSAELRQTCSDLDLKMIPKPLDATRIFEFLTSFDDDSGLDEPS